MRASCDLPLGCFYGGELEPGTFHAGSPAVPEDRAAFLATDDNLPRHPESRPLSPVRDPDEPSCH